MSISEIIYLVSYNEKEGKEKPKTSSLHTLKSPHIFNNSGLWWSSG